MTIHAKYLQYYPPGPLLSAQGWGYQPRPVVRVEIIGPNQKSTTVTALVDSGSDETVFPKDVADRLGIPLTPVKTAISAHPGLSYKLWYGPVALSISDGLVTRTWDATVAFTDAQFHIPFVLGYAGCLQYFDVTFRGRAEELELHRNSTYPGS